MPLKSGSVESPDIYLGTKLQCPTKYVQEAGRMSEEYVVKHPSENYKLPKRAENPFAMFYCPELDVSPELGPEEAPYYQPLIAVVKWMVEIGCIDISSEVSLLSLYSAMPREGHLEVAYISWVI